MTDLPNVPARTDCAGAAVGPIRVAVIDRARTSRDALCRALASDQRIDVVGAASPSTLEADQGFGAFLFHITAPAPGLLDDLGQVAAAHPGATVVVVTAFVDDEIHQRLRSGGATDVLTNDLGLDHVLAAILPAPGSRHLRTVGDHAPQASRAGELGLTEREIDVLRALSEGRSPQQIAHEASISISTVRDHLKHLRHKLDCASAVELIVTAHRLGLLPNLNRPLP